ncbi:hypothetical protein C8R47DRAFT_1148360 [Mycena vitilis]|nr:hypothetical protein C8R47DRAFT_1148360 [Mycena vitilis]
MALFMWATHWTLSSVYRVTTAARRRIPRGGWDGGTTLFPPKRDTISSTTSLRTPANGKQTHSPCGADCSGDPHPRPRVHPVLPSHYVRPERPRAQHRHHLQFAAVLQHLPPLRALRALRRRGAQAYRRILHHRGAARTVPDRRRAQELRARLPRTRASRGRRRGSSTCPSSLEGTRRGSSSRGRRTRRRRRR